MKWHRRLSSLLSPWPTPKKKRSHRRVRLYLEELETRALLSASGVTTAAAATPLRDVTAQTNATTVMPAASSTFSGYTPSQLQRAYGVPSTINGKRSGTGETIAIVDPYNDPNIQSDLATFDVKYSLPTANFTVVDQNGSIINPKSTSVPSNASWGVEESLDVEWAHAIAPGANLVLVEANSNGLSDLMKAVNTASSMANVVSMSWGASEFNGETSYDTNFTTPGVTYVTSAGDSSAYDGPVWPASSPNVLAVGGTTLSLTSSNTISSETAWSATYSRFYGWQGGGGGISSYETAPSFQSSLGISSMRTTPDVAWDANPSTGVSVYDSYKELGWGHVGGTSAGAPAWAGIVADADQNSNQSLSTTQVENALYGAYYKGGSVYSSAFNDIASGNNGYQATTGYDLATGLGSPKVSTLISNLFAAPSPASSSTPNSTTSSTTGGTTMPTSHQGTTNGPVHPLVILELAETVSVPTSISVTIVVISVPNAPTSVPFSGSSGNTTSTVTNLSSAPLPIAQPSLSLAGNTPLFDSSLSGSGPQSAIVFGASGWSGSALSWRLSNSGLSTPAMSELAGDSSGDEPESGNDSSSGDGVRTDCVEVLIFEAAPPALLDGQVSDGAEAAEGDSGSNGGDGGE